MTSLDIFGSGNKPILFAGLTTESVPRALGASSTFGEVPVKIPAMNAVATTGSDFDTIRRRNWGTPVMDTCVAKNRAGAMLNL